MTATLWTICAWTGVVWWGCLAIGVTGLLCHVWRLDASGETWPEYDPAADSYLSWEEALAELRRRHEATGCSLTSR